MSSSFTPAAARPRGVAGWCFECGYSLRGLPPGRPCPECGTISGEDESPAPSSPHLAWSRSVCAGLVLLLLATIGAVSSVLIQPFAERVGGSAAALNMPGPK